MVPRKCFRPRLRGTNLKQAENVKLKHQLAYQKGFRPRLRGTNLKQASCRSYRGDGYHRVSVPDYGELILNNQKLQFS